MGRQNNKLPNNLPQLQNLIRRDPQTYEKEFEQQYRQFQSQMEVLRLNPTDAGDKLAEVSMFLAHTAPCYPKVVPEYSRAIVEVLEERAALLQSNIRGILCKCLMILRNRKLVDAASTLELFFNLFEVQDKALRTMLHLHIVSDVKLMNQKAKNPNLNKRLQNYMHGHLSSADPQAAKKCLDVMVDLYRKQVWDDAKTVNVIASALWSPVMKLKIASLKFFLGLDRAAQGLDDEDDDNEKKQSAGELYAAFSHVKKTRKKKKQLKSNVKEVVKKQHQQEQGGKKSGIANPSIAIQLLHNPQETAERLFKESRDGNLRFEVKLLQINLLTRIIGIHHLLVLNFYQWIVRYLQPHQQEVTQIMADVAQACHRDVPPDVVEPVIRALADNFVNDRCTGEVMAVGLNAIREISLRQPTAMTAELLQDLVEYRRHKDKNVSVAAKSLMKLFQDVNPELLRRKDRGLAGSVATMNGEGKPLQYGAAQVKSTIEGVDLLAAYEAERQAKAEAVARGELGPEALEDEVEDGWESASDTDSEGSWVDISHSSDDEEDQSGPSKSAPNADNEQNADMEETEEEREQEARNLLMSRALTDEDFKRIKRLQTSVMLDKTNRRGKKKRGLKEAEEADGTGIVDPKDITAIAKKAKQEREERIAHAKATKDGEEATKFGGNKKTRLKSRSAGLTNKDKKVTKLFQMIAHSARIKGKKKRGHKELAKLEKLRNSRKKHYR
eukprot:Clim_evm20s201 gene=Clim_evmTU20s201